MSLLLERAVKNHDTFIPSEIEILAIDGGRIIQVVALSSFFADRLPKKKRKKTNYLPIGFSRWKPRQLAEDLYVATIPSSDENLGTSTKWTIPRNATVWINPKNSLI